MNFDVDVVVVGGGGAGLAAALEASRRGASCIILEADKKLGGAIALSGGIVYAAGSSVQQEAGIQDSAESMFQYIMTLNQWSMRTDIVRLLSGDSAAVIDWLIELGNEFPPQWMVKSGVEEVPRGHQSREAGIGVANSLINAVGAAGVEVALGSRVSGLQIEAGRVVGVRVDDTAISAGAVIIATGGFGNNPELLKRLYPTAVYHGDRVFSVYFDVPYNVGDGLLLGESAGGAVVGYNTGLLSPTPGFGRYIEAFIPTWTMLVNLNGRRFMPESAPYAVSGYLINEQPEQRCFAMFDRLALEQGAGDPKFDPHYQLDVGSSSWHDTLIREQAAKGRVKVAQTIAELAAMTGVASDVLQATIEDYNRNCLEGRDPAYEKVTRRFFPIHEPPYYAIEVRACLVSSTHSGLDIDVGGRVLDARGTAVPGLYAAGEVVGCTLGRRYAGGGIGITNALVFGRAAGRGAAADLGFR